MRGLFLATLSEQHLPPHGRIAAMDVHAFVEEMSRDIEDASEILSECDPDEPLSLKYCISQITSIINKAHKRLRDFQRSQPRGRPCR
ncbi:MAG: hypothetical protein EOO38_00095 [Cytophagaceae bacterium]|nr:MAG: hypothetical protein EOO38_00095 [Cytophagaceae bacterium]